MQAMQVGGGQVIPWNDEVRLGFRDGTGKRRQGQQAPVVMRFAYRADLAERMAGRAYRIDHAAGMGQRHRQPGRREPAGCGGDQDSGLHRCTILPASSRMARSGYKVGLPCIAGICWPCSSGKRWKEVVTWLNCREVRWLRRASLTRLITAVTIDVPSSTSAAISVNSTPITLSSLYQPVTSVSRVAAESADNIVCNASRFIPAGNCDSISTSMSTAGFCERSALFLSCQITRRKASCRKALRSATDAGEVWSDFEFKPFLERRVFMIPSACSASWRADPGE